jgi:epoxyqueuosine reductase
MTIQDLSDGLKAEARRVGFDDVGIAPAVAAPGHSHLIHWLESGHEAGMQYMRRNAAQRAHPDALLEGVRSVVVLSMVYGHNDPETGPAAPSRGKVARYARGGDYHRVLWDKLESLMEWLRAQRPTIRGRAVADTAPLLERDFARLAGLGWIGKNTLLIGRRLGSFTVLGALLVDAELAYDAPHHPDHCGTCTRCLEACPTQAFVGPYELDSRRCISYWTIEHKGVLSEPEAGELNGWVFGCDICQDVCPWNRKAPSGREQALLPREEWTDPDLIEWFNLGADDWKARLKGTALSRSKRTGLLRNAALVLGTRGVTEAIAPLVAHLEDRSEDAIVRASAAWALGRIGTTESRAALTLHHDDPDPVVRRAVQLALEHVALPSEKKAIRGAFCPPGPPLKTRVGVQASLEDRADPNAGHTRGNGL